MVDALSECNNNHSASRIFLSLTPCIYSNLLFYNIKRNLYILVVFENLNISSNITLTNDKCILHSEVKVCLPLISASDFHSG